MLTQTRLCANGAARKGPCAASRQGVVTWPLRRAASASFTPPPISKSDACGAFTLAAAGIVGSVVVYYTSSSVLGKILETGIETFDRRVLGVDIHIGRLWLHPFTGQLVVNSFKIDNPKGYDVDHLVTASHIFIDLNMSKLLFSGMRSIEVTKIAFKDPAFHLDYSDAHGGQSNLQWFSEFLSKGKKTAPSAEKAEAKPEEVCDPKKPVKPKRKLHLQEVEVKDLMLDYDGRHIHVGDIHYDDFSSEVAGGLVDAMDDIVCLLFKSILKTALAASLGPMFARHVL